MFLLNEELIFPPVELADDDGVLAIGGDLSTERLILAYKNGIFPWYNEGEPIMWWSPDPRFVLFPAELKVSRSMQRIINAGHFSFTVNKAFSEVIDRCSSIKRKEQPGTWITNAVKTAYTQLHKLGIAHSAETWLDGKLVGGLYGVRMGHVFCGESMFSEVSNASKFAFIQYVQQLEKEGIALIDCQVYTAHLESLGACMIERKKFLEILQQHR
ncbi:MAG: leucyl/phenylalanyl-tRNA--protein transferase [Ferruginibacter sp.]